MITSPVEEPPLYVILREHEEYGPFCRETLRQAMETGNVVPEDWVRKVELPSCWTSVGQLLHGPSEPDPLRVKLRRFYRLGGAASEKVFASADRAVGFCARRIAGRAGIVALVCVAIATGTAFLPDRPFALSVPWILAGLAASVALILRRQFFRGIIACVAVLLIPLGTYRAIPVAKQRLDPNRVENALPPIGEMYSSLPRRSPDLPRVRVRVKSGIPALGLPQLAEEDEGEGR